MKRSQTLSVFGIALLVACATLTAQPSDYTPFPKSRALTLADDAPVPSIIVKFHEGTRVRISSSALTTMPRSSRDESDLTKLRLDGALVSRDLAAVTALLSEPPLVGHVLRAYRSVTETELQTLRAGGEAASAISLPDRDLNVELPLAKGTTFRHVKPILDALNRLDSVEVAWAPLPGSPPSTDSTPSFEWRQKYLPWQGINAFDSWQYPGGRGTNVRICDVEFGWNRDHESLSGLEWVGDGVNYRDHGDTSRGCRSAAHGNAVLSMVGARQTGVGVTGVAPEATVGVQPVGADDFGWTYRADAVVDAAKWACGVDPDTGVVGRPGGVVLIEVQLLVPCPLQDPTCVSGVISDCVGPDGLNYYSHRWFPLEYGDPIGRQDIITAAGLTAVVVEAAGNGGEVLDTADFPDSSGAIMVAASQVDLAGSPAAKECYSNSGSRIDLHAWGGVPGWAEATDYSRAAAGGPCFLSSGSPTYWFDLQDNGPNASYTRSFGGSSAASAIVAGAAANIQGQALARRSGRPLSSRALLALLKATGRQGEEVDPFSDNYIGRMPDLQAARLMLPVAQFTWDCAGLACAFDSSTSNPTIPDHLRFRWDFGNGYTSWQTTPTITHTFENYQSYRVWLEIADSSQVGDAIFQDVTPVQAATHSISGTVTENGTPLPGVTVTATNYSTGTVYSTTTDETGAYQFPELPDGHYGIAASLDGYNFSPVVSLQTIAGADISGVDFTGTPQTFSISGVVLIDGAPFPGVTVTAGSHSDVTDGEGAYEIESLPDGLYPVVASLNGYDFSPAVSPQTIDGADISGVDFTGTLRTFSISGVVLIDGIGRSGVIVSATAHSTTTDETGAYRIPGLPNGTYYVAANLNGYEFSPEFYTRTIAGEDIAGVDFTGAPRTFSISGAITENGVGREGVSVSAGSSSALSGANGTYRISGLSNGTYVVTPYLRGGATFLPPTSTQTINGSSVAGVNFAVVPPSYSVSGTILNKGEGVEGITVRIGLTAKMAITDRYGAYQITGLAAGIHTVRPESSEYTFTPAERTVSLGPGPIAPTDFEASPRE